MTHRFKIPIKYVHDSLDINWDATGVPFVAVQAQDHQHTGAVVYRMTAGDVLTEVLAPGPDSWHKCRIHVRNDGSGCLVGADADGIVSVWNIPGWAAKK